MNHHEVGFYSVHTRLYLSGLPLVVQTVKRVAVMQDSWVPSLGWEDPLEKKQQPTPVFWPESHGQRSLEGYSSPWGHRVGHV